MPKELDRTWQLLDDFAGVAALMHADAGHDDILSTLCELAVKAVGGDHASITNVQSGRFTTVAATSDLPTLADKLQYAAGSGPCVDAIREDSTFRVDDLATDDRWPAFGKAVAEELGMHSLLAHVLPVDDRVLGAVNVYASRPHAFSAQDETLIAIFGATAAATVGRAREQERATQLERALRTSRRIGIALGIIVSTQKVDVDAAWERLRKASQDANIKVSELAEHVIATGSLDHRWGS
jgi:GAF domain-containing protein